MVVKVLDMDRLVMHYLWMLKDLKEGRKLLGEWGFDVNEERRLGVEVRQVLSEMIVSGRTVI